MGPLSPRLALALERIRAAGSVRVHPRRFRIVPGEHGRYRVARPQLSLDPGEFIATAGPHSMSGRTVLRLIDRGALRPARYGWSFVGRFYPAERL